MTEFQEGHEHARSALFPDLPDGYRRGRAQHTAFVDIGLGDGTHSDRAWAVEALRGER